METLIEGADTDSLLSGIEARKQRTIQKLQQKYWDHYDGLTSAELRTADRNLYEAMRRRGLLPDLQPRPRVTERQRRKELRSMYKQMCGQAHRRLTRSELRQVDPNLYKQLHRHNLLHLVPSGERPESPQRESPVMTLEEKILDRVNLLLDRYRNEFAGKARGWLKKHVSPYYKQLHRAGLLFQIPRLRDVPKSERINAETKATEEVPPADLPAQPASADDNSFELVADVHGNATEPISLPPEVIPSSVVHRRECQSSDPPEMLLREARALFSEDNFHACMGVLSHIFNGRKDISETIRYSASQLLNLCLNKLGMSEVNHDLSPDPITGNAADAHSQWERPSPPKTNPVPTKRALQAATSSGNTLYDDLARDSSIASYLEGEYGVRSLCEKLLAASSNDARYKIFRREIQKLSIGITRRLLQLLYERNLLDDHHVKKLSESVGDTVSFRGTKLTFSFV